MCFDAEYQLNLFMETKKFEISCNPLFNFFYFVFFDRFSQNAVPKENMWLVNSLGKGVTACSLRDMATPICTCMMRVTLHGFVRFDHRSPKRIT